LNLGGNSRGPREEGTRSSAPRRGSKLKQVQGIGPRIGKRIFSSLGTDDGRHHSRVVPQEVEKKLEKEILNNNLPHSNELKTRDSRGHPVRMNGRAPT